MIRFRQARRCTGARAIQIAHCLELIKIDLARQIVEEMAAFQPVHDGPLHLGQMQFHTCILQPVIDRFQAFQTARINVVHSRTHQYHMLHARMRTQHMQDHVFKKTSICKIEALIDAHRYHAGRDDDIMSIHIPKMRRARHLPHKREVRTAGIIEMEEERKHDTRQNTEFDTKTERHQNRSRHGREV